MGHVLGCVLLAYCKGKEEEGKARNHDTREMLRWEMEQREKHGWDRSNWDPIPTEEVRKHGWHHRSRWKVFALSVVAALMLLAPPRPASAATIAPPTASNYSLPFSIYYNNGGNYYERDGKMVYPPPSPRSFGFIADNYAHTVGTNTFDFSGDPAWPNVIASDAHGGCPAPGVRTDTPLGPLCCAPGGCVAQEGNATAVAAMTARRVAAQVSPALEGNCVIDFEGWNNVVWGNQYGSCPTGPPQDPDDPPPASNIQRNLSIARARQAFPNLPRDQAEAEAARAYYAAATRLLVTVLATARATRPRCHWGFWGAVGQCGFRRPCLAPDAPGNPSDGEWLCGIDHPTEGARLWAILQQQRPIWAASDALFPQIYLESPARDAGLAGKGAGFDRAGLRAVVRAAVRGAALVGGRPVLPFAATYCARQDFAEHFFRSSALHCTATARILIPAQCSAIL